jgi:PAS domain S-box-containing protein
VQDYATRLHATFESISDAIYALDEEDRFTHVNGQAERLLRHRAADLLGRRMWDIFPEARRTELPERFGHARRSRETVRFEFFFRPFASWFEVCVYPPPTGLTVCFRDVTQERGHAALLERQTASSTRRAMPSSSAGSITACSTGTARRSASTLDRRGDGRPTAGRSRSGTMRRRSAPRMPRCCGIAAGPGGSRSAAGTGAS